MSRFLRHSLLSFLLVFAACAPYAPQTAPPGSEGQSVSPEDLAPAKPEAQTQEAEAWTPPSRNLMAEVPPAYRAAVRAVFGDALETSPVLDYFDHGMEAYEKGDYEEAERSLKKVLEALPDFLPVQFNLGLVYYQQKRYPKAIETFEQLIQNIRKVGVDDVSLAAQPDLLQDTLINLGMAYLQTRQPKKAIEAFNQVMPNEIAHYNLIVAYHQLGDHDKVLSLAQSYLDQYGGDAQVFNLQGLAYYHLQQYDKASQAFERAAAQDPQDAQIQYNLGLTYLELKQSAKARAAFQNARALDPNIKVDEYLAALGQPGSREARDHYNRAVEFYNAGKLEAAINEWKQAVELQPDFAEAHINLAAAYTQTRRLGEAIKHLEAAVRLKPNAFEAHYNLGVAYSQLHRYLEAVRVLKRAVQLRPKHAEAQFALGMALYRSGQREAALEPLRQATRLKPVWLDPWMNLGLLLGELNRPDPAIEVFQNLLRYHPRNSDAYYNLGVLYFNKGDRPKAIESLERALEYDPTNTKAFAMLQRLQQ